jgi:alpha-beta hydrolase superfamily lysophospholipase
LTIASTNPFESSIHTRDGLRLAAEHYRVLNRRARVVVVHGYAEHLRRYEKFVAALAQAGYECHLFDLRGHGRSEGVRGHVARFEDYRHDLELFVEQTIQPDSARDAASGSERLEPLFLVAHSLGGLIALDFVLHRPAPFRALAVSSPFLSPAFKLPPLVNQVSAVAAYVLPTLSLKSALDPKWLSHDPAVVESYVRDPLIFSSVTPSWWHAVHRAQNEIFERAREIETPALFLLGDADRIADPLRSRAVFERMGSADKRLEVYPGFFHEVLNELGRERVIDDLLSWLDGHCR